MMLQKCFQSNFKSPNSLSQSQYCLKVQRLKVSSETSGNFFIVPLIKSRLKKQVIYFQNTMAQNTYYHSEREEREYSEEILNQSKTENQQGELQILHLMCEVQEIFRSLAAVSFGDCSTLLSLGLVPQPVGSSPCQVSHDSGISNILEFPTQSRFTFTSSHNAFLSFPRVAM